MFKQAAVFLAALLLAGFGAFAQQSAPPIEVLNPPQPVESGGKIEVIEFFWYGCPHCYALEPSLISWLKTMPKDVVFKRVHPAIGGWERHAAIFYTLEAMGLLDQLHQKVFEAIHRQNLNLTNQKIRDEWLAKQGVDVAKYADVEKSFSVATKLQRARQMAMSYKVETVPRIVVDGKYVVPGENAFLAGTVDQVIAMARRQKAAGGQSPPVAQR